MPDIEQRLRDSANSITYPPTPDIAGMVTRRLLAPPQELGGRAEPLSASQGTFPSARPAGEMLPFPGARRRGQLPSQIVRLAAAVIAFVVVGGLMALVFQMAGDPSARLGGAGDAEDVAPRPATTLLLVDLQPGDRSIRSLQIRPVDPVTMLDAPSAAPIVLGHHWQHAVSPDGRVLAAATFPTQTWAGGSLRLFDVETWREIIDPVPLDGAVSNLTFSDDGEAVYWTSGDYVDGSYDLMRYDRAGGTTAVVSTFIDRFVPHEMHFFEDGARLAIYGVPTDSGNLAVGAPHVLVVDLATGAIQSDIVLDSITAWQIRGASEDDDAYPVRIYQPGIAWDSERSLLYVVHADEDVITVVDLERGTVEATAFVPRQSVTERLLDWLVPPASASPVPWTSRIALLSADGERLFIAGSADRWIKQPGTQWNEGWSEDVTWTGVQVIDTANLSEATEIDLSVVSDMRLSPDGETLVVQTYASTQRESGELLRTEQRIIGLSTDDLSERGEVEMSGSYTVAGFSADGRTLYLNRQWMEGETPHVELIALDTETWTSTVARAFQGVRFVELVAGQ